MYDIKSVSQSLQVSVRETGLCVELDGRSPLGLLWCNGADTCYCGALFLSVNGQISYGTLSLLRAIKPWVPSQNTFGPHSGLTVSGERKRRKGGETERENETERDEISLNKSKKKNMMYSCQTRWFCWTWEACHKLTIAGPYRKPGEG